MSSRSPKSQAGEFKWPTNKSGVISVQNEAKGAEAIERMLLIWDEELCRQVGLAIRPDLDHRSTDRLLRKLKGSAGGSLGNAFSSKYPDIAADWPTPLQNLVQRLESSISVHGAESD